MQNFQQFLTQTQAQIADDITDYIQQQKLPSPLHEAALYAMTNGGKRVRPLLVACSYLTLAKQHDLPLPNNVRQAMLAVEFLHGYSLVHDDLPCMDDDELRRGRPTTHIVFGEAVALLAGDVLQTLAFQSLSDGDQNQQLLYVFAPRARRMVVGQMLDLNGENQQLDQSQLQTIHQDKTGALIEAAVLMGAICANAAPYQQTLLQTFAQSLGLAFQVQDDILDVIGDSKQLGKPVGSDEKLNKSTYVKLMGIEPAKHYSEQLFINAKKIIMDEFGTSNPLLDLLDWLWERQY